MHGTLAHIFESSVGAGPWWIFALVAFVAVLVVENHVVAGATRRRAVARAAAASLILSLAAFGLTLSSTTVSAQSAGALLPDLISDPPRPSYFKELNTANGSTRLVVTFDGYVHNIGEGALDVVGNPQEPDGMKQRVMNNGDWEEVGSPTVRYETDDGHNHFHLIEAVDYVLWNELQGAQSALGSKIGFCLVDSEQMEPGASQAYSEELDNFCQENNPDATSLRMGITPGWRDIYDATTTLQWVDVSNVAPGRYWIGAVTDPNDEIVESREDNNDLVFSDVSIAVPGFAPRPTAVVVDGEPVEFELRSSTYGTVGQAVYVIEQAPAFGSLNVPVGAALTDPIIQYTPDPGFVGEDAFEFSVRNSASAYPIDAPTGVVSLAVERAVEESDEPLDGIAPPLLDAGTAVFESRVGQFYERSFEVVGGDGGEAHFYATNLPPGLVANPTTGVVSGIPVETGIFDVELSATQDGLRATQEVPWVVNGPEQGAMRALPDHSTPRGELTQVRIGSAARDRQYRVEGLPEGIELDSIAPLLSGIPTEVGVFEVVVSLLEDEEVVDTMSFTWTIRFTTDVVFPL